MVYYVKIANMVEIINHRVRYLAFEKHKRVNVEDCRHNERRRSAFLKQKYQVLRPNGQYLSKPKKDEAERHGERVGDWIQG